MQCAESALKSVVGDLTHTYFVGNAPMAHMAIQPTEEMPDLPSYKARTNVNGVLLVLVISEAQDF